MIAWECGGQRFVEAQLCLHPPSTIHLARGACAAATSCEAQSHECRSGPATLAVARMSTETTCTCASRLSLSSLARCARSHRDQRSQAAPCHARLPPWRCRSSRHRRVRHKGNRRSHGRLRCTCVHQLHHRPRKAQASLRVFERPALRPRRVTLRARPVAHRSWSPVLEDECSGFGVVVARCQAPRKALARTPRCCMPKQVRTNSCVLSSSKNLLQCASAGNPR